MREQIKAILTAATLIAGLAAAPVLYAEQPAGGMSMMDRGSGNMMGMMGWRSGMARNCGAMMANGGAAPNAQWHRH